MKDDETRRSRRERRTRHQRMRYRAGNASVTPRCRRHHDGSRATSASVETFGWPVRQSVAVKAAAMRVEIYARRSFGFAVMHGTEINLRQPAQLLSELHAIGQSVPVIDNRRFVQCDPLGDGPQISS